MGRKRQFSDEERIARKKEAMRVWKKNNPERIKHHELTAAFGIGLEDYNQMFANQKGCCAICGKHQDEMIKKLHVDNCHTTGKVRGLLCINCNLAIGNFYDNITLLKNAIKYLKQHGI